MVEPIDLNQAPAETGFGLLMPFANKLGHYEGRDIGQLFDLTAMGAHVETLHPGSMSALRHWHSHSDELVCVLDGELMLVNDDGEQLMQAGMFVGFKAGVENAHHLVNRSDKTATFLVVGTRHPDDTVSYPDDDLRWQVSDEGKWTPVRKDGTPY